jgi:ubiquinone/menaquinone biosynthesis C-methylase UbiE
MTDNILIAADRPNDPNNIKLQIKQHWAESSYYDLVEQDAYLDVFWGHTSIFRKLFDLLDTHTLVELACGHGRHSAEILLKYPICSLVLVDINETNISYCRRRFAERNNVKFYVNSGSDIACCEDESVTAVFSYDAMVHFEYDDVAAYLHEIRRVLKPGGRALLHHSNNSQEAGKLYSDCVHWRNFMSTQLFTHMAARAGIVVVEQKTMHWAGAVDLDAVTLLQRN